MMSDYLPGVWWETPRWNHQASPPGNMEDQRKQLILNRETVSIMLYNLNLITLVPHQKIIVHYQLPVGEVTLDIWSEPDLISWKALKAGLMLLWEKKLCLRTTLLACVFQPLLPDSLSYRFYTCLANSLW